MTTNPRRRGALIGAGVGGVLRGALVFLDLKGEGGVLLLFVVLITVAIGALCGALAGTSRTIVRGAVWGALLAGGMFALFILPVAFIASLFDAGGTVEKFSLPYLLERAAAGAIAGAVGVWVGLSGVSRPLLSASKEKVDG